MSKPRPSAPRSSARREVKRSINQYGVFPVTVSRVEQLTDSFVRVSLTGRSLLHAAAPISDGTGQVYDAYIKLLIPPAGASGPTMIEPRYLLAHPLAGRPRKRAGVHAYLHRQQLPAGAFGGAGRDTPAGHVPGC